MLSVLVGLLGLGGALASTESGGAVQTSGAEPVPPLELTPDERAWIAAHPRIVLGIDQDWAPLILKKPDGGFAGIDGDMVARLNVLLGTQITFETGRWADMVEKLKARQIDGLSSAAVHEERRAFADFTQPYTTHRKYLYARSDNSTNIRSIENLAGKRIGYQTGNLFEQKTLASVPTVRAVPMDSPQAAFAAVLSGEIDGFVGSISTEYQFQKSEAARIQPLFRLGPPLDLVFAIRNDWPELTALLDKGIAAISALERLRIMDRYTQPIERRLIQVTVTLSDAERAWIEAHPNIRMGIDAGWQPYIINNPDGRVTGMEADFLARINALTGLNLRIEQGVWKDMVERAKRKEIDGLLALTHQKEREPYFLFSDPTYSTYRNVFARKGDLSVYRDMASLAGKRVGYQAGNAPEEKLLKKYPQVSAVAKAENADLLDALLQGEIDAVLSGNDFIYLLRKRTVTEIGAAFFPPDSEIVLRYAVRKDWPELQAIINKALAAIPAEERLAITERYMGDIRSVKSAAPALALTEAERRWLDAKHTVRVQVGDWPPYTFAQPVASGMSVDYFDAIAKRFGIAVEYVPGRFGWSEAMGDVKGERRHFDLLLTMHRSPEREKDFALTADYLRMPWAIYARKDGPFISGLGSLRGKTVAAEKGYFMTNKLKAEHPDIQILEVSRSEDALRAVSTGQADAYVGSLVNAGFLIREQGLDNLVVAAPTPYGDHTQAMAIRKDWPELASLIDKGLAAMTPSERDAISAKWNPQKVMPHIDYTLVWQVAVGATLILFAFLYWNRKLAKEIALRQRSEAELKASEAELRYSRDAAESANQAKSMFLADMSHELRTPLNAILGFSELLRRDSGLAGRDREHLDIINHSGEHLLGLINDILDISKIEAGRVKLQIAPLDLHALVRDLVGMMRQRALEKGLELQLEQSSRMVRYIKGDEVRLRQVLVNLLGNAVKFTERGTITLRLDAPPDPNQPRLSIEVEDTGPGIAPEDQARVFDPFVQAGQAAAQKGTGLGLSITRQLVELMGGRIGVTSRLGQGSCFRIDLPVEIAAAAEVAGAREAGGEVLGLAPGQPEWRILIVEDQRENALLLGRLLEGAGFQIRTAANGREGIKCFRQWRPHFIWMDWRMPVMDGLEATRRIRALEGGEAVKIVALTASVFAEQREEVLAAGVDDILHKPLQPAEIFACLGRFLGVRFLRREDAPAATATVEQAPDRVALAVLPDELRRELADALVALDTKRIDALIGRVAERDAALAKVLRQHADNFNYGAIEDALQSGV
ncbi:MAG TPA: transporter substrate-binding domain-containing protein [Candidatus Contendobacter sp.]|nr:transporter substrate-binding domain-containing protein [Candidatus Contendobacter sp.]